MKITDIKAVYPKWNREPGRVWQSCFWQIVVRIDTDAGVTGFGVGGGGEPGALVINRHLRHHLLGRTMGSTDDIRSTWDDLYLASLPYGRAGIPLMALSGVDLALWDLLGQAERKPVYDLLGGRKRDRIRAYATGSNFALARDKGFTAVKFFQGWTGDSDYDAAAETAALARETVGPNGEVMIDSYMGWAPEVVLKMAHRLAPYEILWFEDTCTPDHLEELAKLRPQVKPILLAGGEHDFSHHTFERIASTGALDIWQPDITWCGGITAGLRILEIARRYGIPVIPHRGGEIWGLHLLMATDCTEPAEAHSDQWIPASDGLWLGMPDVIGGYLQPDESPGFGVTVNTSMI